MATPTITTKNFQTIWDCESVTGAVGNKPVLESEIKKQGSNSVGFTMSTVGANNRMAFDGTIPNSGDLTGEHVRLWTTNIVFPNIDSFANGGIQLYLSDGTNESYWTIAGNDTVLPPMVIPEPEILTTRQVLRSCAPGAGPIIPVKPLPH